MSFTNPYKKEENVIVPAGSMSSQPVSSIPAQPPLTAQSKVDGIVVGNAADETHCNRVHAETNKLIAEANESRTRQLISLEQIAVYLHRELDEKAKKIKEAAKHYEEGERYFEEGRILHEKGVELNRKAEEQRKMNLEMEAELEAKKKESENSKQLAEAAKKGAEEAKRAAQDEQERAKKLFEQDQMERQALEKAQKEASRGREETERIQEESRKLQAQLWPSGLKGEKWQDWRDDIVKRATSDNSIALLLGRLHIAAALEQANETQLEVLRDISRQLYKTFADRVDLIVGIAETFNQAARGQFVIKTVRVGDNMDPNFMRPPGGSRNSTQVNKVTSWAIRDASGNWQFPAEVA
jgi:hypothetical protein